jgi:hypothetical protein
VRAVAIFRECTVFEADIAIDLEAFEGRFLGPINVDAVAELVKDDVVIELLGSLGVLGINRVPMRPIRPLPAVVVDQAAADFAPFSFRPEAESVSQVMDDEIDEGNPRALHMKTSAADVLGPGAGDFGFAQGIGAGHLEIAEDDVVSLDGKESVVPGISWPGVNRHPLTRHPTNGNRLVCGSHELRCEAAEVGPFKQPQRIAGFNG